MSDGGFAACGDIDEKEVVVADKRGGRSVRAQRRFLFAAARRCDLADARVSEGENVKFVLDCEQRRGRPLVEDDAS